MGAGRAAGGARALRREAPLPLAGRASSSSSPARCRATSPTTSTPSAIRELTRRHVPSALDCEGERAADRRSRRSRSSSRPNQQEAEALVGQEFHDDEDFVLALDGIADRGARNVIITTEGGCYALLREDRTRAPLPRRRAAARAGLAGRAAATRCSAAFARRLGRGPRARGVAARGGRRRRGLGARARRRPLRPARGARASRPASSSPS